VKVRIGIGATVASPEAFEPILRGVGEQGFDSIWCSEVLTAEGFDPFIALTWAAARYPKLKLGTTMLLPGRNVLRLAKQLASLDALSAGRLLVTFVPGINRSPEAEAIGVAASSRRAAIEETLPLLRELLAGEPVSHDGAVASFTDVTLSPGQFQQPLEFWLGGMATKSLQLCGRQGDGWLPSLCTPETAVAGRKVIEQGAADAGRSIDPEHFGVSIGYSNGPLSAAARARFAARVGDADVDELVPTDHRALRSLLERFLDAGFSKFVVRPLVAPADWDAELATLAAAVLDLQT
jgi:probable F420-dependent oxidoreductase